MSKNILGYVDQANGRDLSGWVANTDELNRPLSIEVCVNGQAIATALADQWREDLQALGFGDGRHAFHCTIPESYAGAASAKVTVRAEGSDYLLTHNGKPEIDLNFSIFIEYIAGDIVNNCNLRCPFCLVDYSEVNKTELMTEATFTKLIPLMRTVPQGGFWLSCLHEPTLHPKFEHFLGLIPDDCKGKCWFTTNLAKPLSEAQFVAWAESGLQHINISFDTLNPEIFAVVRKFGRYEVFERNLNALVKVFRRYPNPPKIRYITVVMKCNLEEVPAIIERTHNEWLSSENEIRYTYNVQHFNDEFRKEFFLSPQDWERLTGLLKDVPHHHVVAYPPLEDYFEKILPPANYFEIQKFIDDPTPPLKKLPRPLQLRFRPNGSIVVANLERSFRVNANDLEDPVAYFRGALE